MIYAQIFAVHQNVASHPRNRQRYVHFALKTGVFEIGGEGEIVVERRGVVRQPLDEGAPPEDRGLLGHEDAALVLVQMSTDQHQTGEQAHAQNSEEEAAAQEERKTFAPRLGGRLRGHRVPSMESRTTRHRHDRSNIKARD